ncbi:tRNA-specific adenosine deaminase [filamentous cyanobacterium CCP1]|nr:tRNA-specific adenosine deaminase [filamentous cyanobacterium CCP2]PSB67562.1 tRNA-specific adenosine deaminase [filamentous cyanobacterium CCP1]
MTPEEMMQVAIEAAETSKTPYGAVIAKGNQIVEVAGNTVLTEHDPTGHAEVNVIRKLATKLGDRSLEGYTLYTTYEPCPMCASACVWASISEIIYGASIDDFEDYNPNLIDLRCKDVIQRSPISIHLKGGVLLEQCKHLHDVYPIE